jgi:succinate dehydrogenase / fumarate reductase cytochrome b subunit
MSSLKTTLSGYAGYRGREGHYSFLLHRITGLGTALFLTIHIIDTSWVYFAPNAYQFAIDLYRSTLFGIGEIFLVFSVLFHGVNGLRVAFFDLIAPKFWQIKKTRSSTRWTLAVTLVLWIPAAGIMIYNILHHNFGLFGG